MTSTTIPPGACRGKPQAIPACLDDVPAVLTAIGVRNAAQSKLDTLERDAETLADSLRADGPTAAARQALTSGDPFGSLTVADRLAQTRRAIAVQRSAAKLAEQDIVAARRQALPQYVRGKYLARHQALASRIADAAEELLNALAAESALRDEVLADVGGDFLALPSPLVAVRSATFAPLTRNDSGLPSDQLAKDIREMRAYAAAE